MVNWKRLSRFSQIRNKRQSLRRGGAPPRAPVTHEVAAPLTGVDGSLCLGMKTEKDCTGNAAMKKTCNWWHEYSDAKGKKHPARCQGKAAKHVLSESGRQSMDKFALAESDRVKTAFSQARHGEDDSQYSQYSEDSQGSEMSDDMSAPRTPMGRPSPQESARAAPRARASKKAPTPAQLRRSEAKAAGVEYVPVMSPNAPLGCVHKEYNIVSKKGKSFVSSRCIDSKDPKVNDQVNCMINRETNKCKTVARD